MLEDAFPTTAIASRFEKDDIAIPYKREVAQFLTSNPAFDFSNTNIQSYLNRNPAALNSGNNRAGVVKQLKAMQRVFRLTPRYSE